MSASAPQAMSPQTQGHADQHGDEHAHPGWQVYTRIAVILTIITAIEVATYYIGALKDYLVWILMPLSALKFVIVVGYYMHLKFDHKLLTYTFIAGMITAGSIMLAFLGLFDRLW